MSSISAPLSGDRTPYGFTRDRVQEWLDVEVDDYSQRVAR